MGEYFRSMPLDMKNEFHENNPQLPEIFFMSEKEKKKYFFDLNEKFKLDLKKTPKRKSISKPKIKFKAEFEVKGFS